MNRIKGLWIQGKIRRANSHCLLLLTPYFFVNAKKARNNAFHPGCAGILYNTLCHNTRGVAMRLGVRIYRCTSQCAARKCISDITHDSCVRQQQWVVKVCVSGSGSQTESYSPTCHLSVESYSFLLAREYLCLSMMMTDVRLSIIKHKYTFTASSARV